MSEHARQVLTRYVVETIENTERDELPWSEVEEFVMDECDVSDTTAGRYIRDYCSRRKEQWDEQYITGMAEADENVRQEVLSQSDNNDDGEDVDKVSTANSFDGSVAELDMEPGDVKTVNLAAWQTNEDDFEEGVWCNECGGNLQSTGRDESFCVDCGSVHWNGLPVLEDIGHPLVPDVDTGNYIRRKQEGNTTDVENVADSMADKDFAALLVGETGVGKDFLVRVICAATNRPVVRVNFGEGILYEDLVGGFEPNGDKDKGAMLEEAKELAEEHNVEVSTALEVVDSESDFKFSPGFLYQAVSNGWVFLADELNAAGPEATMPLHGVTEMEGARELSVRETGETLTPHKEFMFVGTMNPPYYPGTKELNDAFKTRFNFENLDYLPRGAEQRLVFSQTPLDADNKGDKQFVEDITEAVEKLRSSYKQQDIITPISHRELIKIGKDARRVGHKQAAEKVLLNLADPSDENTISKTLDVHLSDDN